jgi:branched-chain amino acid transport system ATP-binding protein/branched-chain amino acid transport system permease protein
MSARVKTMQGQAARRGARGVHLPVRGKVALGVAAYALTAAVTMQAGDAVLTSVVIIAALYGVAAMNLTVLIGWAGQPSVMTAALLLYGASGWVFFGSLGLGALPSALLVAISGFALGLVVSLPARRLAGLYLLLSTFVVHFLITGTSNAIQTETDNLAGYFPKTPSAFGVEISSETSWVIFSVAFLGVVHLYLRWLRRGTLANSWRLIKCGTHMASVVGVRVPRALAVAFGVTSAWCALSGMFVGSYFLNVSFDSYTLLLAVNFVVMVVVGGMGSLPGAIFGALLIVGLPQFLTTLVDQNGTWAAVQTMFFAVIGIAFLVFAPNGIGELPKLLSLARVRARRRARTRDHAAETFVPEGSIVALHDVDVRYGAGEQALRGVCLTLEPGKVHTVLGQNGAGKTTLLHTVAGHPPGVVAHQRGAVGLREPGTTTTRWLASSDAPGTRVGLGIALVPAEDKVFRNLTVRSQLEEAVKTGRSRIGDRAHAVVDLLERFPQLEGRLDARGYQLSGGERQQLALACALARAPKVLVIDEATLGLSPANGLRMCESIRELAAAADIAVLLAEQNAAIAERVSDTVTVLMRGSCLYQGPVGDQLAQSLRQAYLASGDERAVALGHEEVTRR